MEDDTSCSTFEVSCGDESDYFFPQIKHIIRNSERWCKQHHNGANTGISSGKSGNKVHVLSPPAAILEDDLEDDDNISLINRTFDYILFPEKWRPYIKYAKLSVFVFLWLLITIIFMMRNEKIPESHQINVPKGKIESYIIPDTVGFKKLFVELEGAMLPDYYGNLSKSFMEVWVNEVVTSEPLDNLEEASVLSIKNVSEFWQVPLVSDDILEKVPEIKRTKVFELKEMPNNESGFVSLTLKFRTNLDKNLPLSLTFNLERISINDGVIYAALVLCGLYVVIIFEIIHRTLAAMLASTISIGILAYLDVRPTLSEIVTWIDTETMLLLFSMMVIVTIISETGLFDSLAVLAFKLTRGKGWPLILTVCLFTVFLSCFLDSVTTALLLTPVTIRLCEVMKLNPVPILIYIIIYSNIGGAITPVGDPPNVIIASNKDIVNSGVTFATFTLHMGVGVAISSVSVQLLLNFIYRNESQLKLSDDGDQQEVRELKGEIAVWKRAAASVSSYSRDEEIVKESMMKRTSKLIGKLHATRTTSGSTSNRDTFEDNLEALERQYRIRDKALLIKVIIVLLFVVPSFFLHSVPAVSHLGMGWTAFLGALLLLILYDKDNLDSILSRVEWSTLVFFASLFILMEALSRLGLIDWIGDQTEAVVMSVEEEFRLTVAILLILWVSATVSAVVDNIPLTTMMVRISTNLAKNSELNLPLQPLVWALAFGACFGGNGTLFASSSNIVCAGVAEQHGYKFTFMDFMKVGFPVMLMSVLTVTAYLIVAHVLFTWH